ncbi:DUF421 domain-containing protein [Oscillospiraceae bacterium HV4-5-C5C]|nr:DUF421 domain-containing protein [Oscillospiraceae bacterium HV4-5-C5C]
MAYYLQVLIKLLVTVVLLLIYIKISGRSQLSPMSSFDQIGNMVVGAIGGSTLLNPEISVLDSSVFITIWIAILLLLRYAKGKNLNIKALIDGQRIQLIRQGQLRTAGFQKARVSVRDVETLLHNEGIQGFHELDNLWFETNGQLTYNKKGEQKLSLILIEEGIINQAMLEYIGKDEAWLQQEIKQRGLPDAAAVFCAEWASDKLWIYPYLNDNHP